jgi:hypothetical protein
MLRIKMSASTAVVAAVLALGVSPAFALQEFHANSTERAITEEDPGYLFGSGVGVQSFKFGTISVKCNSTSLDGPDGWEENARLKLVVSYEDCSAKVGSKAATTATFSSSVEFSFNNHGYVEFGTGGVELEPVPGREPVSVKVSGIECRIAVPAQILPKKAIKRPEELFTAAKYLNVEVANPNTKEFPSGVQHDLEIFSEAKGVAWKYEEGQCLTFTKTKGMGTYKGNLAVELLLAVEPFPPQGNLEFF